jgi:hypothetical protein
MFIKGISAYLGAGQTLQKNIDYINRAARLGFNVLFTSLHTPEADKNTLLKDFEKFVKSAKDANYKVVADISPLTFKLFDTNTENFGSLTNTGVDEWRLDFGFSEQEIVKISQRFNIWINASTVNDVALNRLL